MKGCTIPVSSHVRLPASALAIAFAASLLTAPPAFAEADESAPVVVTATRTGEGDASATTIVSSREIERLQSPTLLGALDDVAGVRAVSTGGIGGGSYVTIRGGEPNFTLVLIDGIRVNDTTNTKGGGFDFGLIDPSLVDRLEVDRGAGSAIHGSDALSGVINIRLREPQAGVTAITAQFRGGTDGEFGSGASFRHGWSTGGLLLAGSYYTWNLWPW